MAVDPIRRTRIYKEIARRLEEQIFDGRLRPGDTLPSERELMEHYGVGRPAVREAFLTLQKSGLIAVQNGERARVTRPSASNLVDELGSSARYLLSKSDGVQEFQQARMLFEVGLVRYAAEHATEQDIARLAEALKNNEASVSDMAAFARTDVAFHFVLAEVPRNSIFVALHTALAEWLTEQRDTSLRRPGAARSALKAHRAIFKAVKEGDCDAAESAMKQHLASVEDYYWRTKRGQSGGSAVRARIAATTADGDA